MSAALVELSADKSGVGAAVLQAALGVITLVTLVPLPLAMLHQAGAAILLGIATALAWRVRRA